MAVLFSLTLLGPIECCPFSAQARQRKYLWGLPALLWLLNYTSTDGGDTAGFVRPESKGSKRPVETAGRMPLSGMFAAPAWTALPINAASQIMMVRGPQFIHLGI